MGDINIPKNLEYKPQEFHISSGVLADNLAKKVFGGKDKTKAPKGAEEKKDSKKGIIELEPYEGPLRKFFKKSEVKDADKVKAKEKQDTKISLQDNLLRGSLALTTFMYIHETGHAAQIGALGGKVSLNALPTFNKTGFTVWKSWTGYKISSSDNKTGKFNKGPDAGISIAGIRNTKIASSVILEHLRNNRELTPRQKSFWAMTGLLSSLDFPVYALNDTLIPHPVGDISRFCSKTNISKGTICGLAGLDLLFNNKKLKYFWDTMWGKDVEPPQQSDWDVYFDYKTLPMSGNPGVGSVGIQYRF